jgi:hypothetical protein
VNTSEDVAAHLPEALTNPAIDPIRDLLVDALTGLLQSYEYRADIAVAYCDVIRSIKQYLAALASDRGANKARGEDDEALRARVIGQQACVLETAIAAGVDAILSLYTDSKCSIVDSALDCWFIHDGTDGNGGPAKWHSFLGGGPNYPDRYFEDDVNNNSAGDFRPNSSIGGARVFNDALGRHFLLRVPDLGFNLRDAALIFDGTPVLGVVPPGIAAGGGFFVGDGSTVPGGAFLDASAEGPLAVYRAIASFVNSVAGQSVRWSLLSDIDT